MSICHKRKLIFVHIPKNGGTSFESHLSLKNMGHPRWFDYARTEFWNNYFKMAIIRNPYSRAFSCYNYARMKKSYYHNITGKSLYGKHPEYDMLTNVSFVDALKLLNEKPALFGVHWRLQSEWVTDINGNIMVDKLFNLETIDDELKLFGITKSMPIVNSSNSKCRNYTADEISLVNQYYKRDFELLGFEEK